MKTSSIPFFPFSFIYRSSELSKRKPYNEPIRKIFICSLLVSFSTLAAVSSRTPQTYCRYVPERSDDFAWENDLIAFRTYGPALETSKEGSGFDCWLKRVKYPIINKWYANAQHGISYYKDNGEGHDPYPVGGSRGCGGLAVWKAGKLYPSDVYKDWRVVFQSHSCCVFELYYTWKVGSDEIAETKRFTIELGERLFRVESTFLVNGKPSDIDIAIGLLLHDKEGSQVEFNKKRRWMTCWGRIGNSELGTAVVLSSPQKDIEFKKKLNDPEDENHALLIIGLKKNEVLSYYAGYGWKKAEEIKTQEEWLTYIKYFSSRP